MRRASITSLLLALVVTLCLAGAAAAKPPPKVLTANVCEYSLYQTFWVQYTYSGFKHVQAVGYDLDTPDGVFESTWGLAPDPVSGSGVMAFSWGGVIVANQATAIRATVYASSPNRPVGISDWIPITDNSLGGLSNNGWPSCV
jgi:hypothetical protein